MAALKFQSKFKKKKNLSLQKSAICIHKARFECKGLEEIVCTIQDYKIKENYIDVRKYVFQNDSYWSNASRSIVEESELSNISDEADSDNADIAEDSYWRSVIKQKRRRTNERECIGTCWTRNGIHVLWWTDDFSEVEEYTPSPVEELPYYAT